MVTGMYNCEKCLYEEMCDQLRRHLWGTWNGEKECSDFKDRNNYVEVVRCKDCKRFEVCFPKPNLKKTHEHAFCSYGERKANERT